MFDARNFYRIALLLAGLPVLTSKALPSQAIILKHNNVMSVRYRTDEWYMSVSVAEPESYLFAVPEPEL